MNRLTTFIIPSIDRPTLGRAIESAAMQSHLSQEVLYKIDVDRIGESTIRNELIQQAKSEWVSFLDDDDTVTYDYVARLQEEIDAHPEADAIHFREYFIRTGQILPTWPDTSFGNIGISFSVKRQVALDNPFVEQPFEDLAFIKTLEEKGYNIFFSKYITYHVRH